MRQHSVHGPQDFTAMSADDFPDVGCVPAASVINRLVDSLLRTLSPELEVQAGADNLILVAVRRRYVVERGRSSRDRLGGILDGYKEILGPGRDNVSDGVFEPRAGHQ